MKRENIKNEIYIIDLGYIVRFYGTGKPNLKNINWKFKKDVLYIYENIVNGNEYHMDTDGKFKLNTEKYRILRMLRSYPNKELAFNRFIKTLNAAYSYGYYYGKKDAKDNNLSKHFREKY